MKWLLTLLLLTTWLAIPVRAEKWALLVGINNYPNDISPRRYCVADVEAFRRALVNVAGFKEDKIFLMTDGMTDRMEPTHINVIARLGILSHQVKADDTFVFYFSGHGIFNNGNSFLLAANSDTTTIDTLEMSAIPLDDVFLADGWLFFASAMFRIISTSSAMLTKRNIVSEMVLWNRWMQTMIHPRKTYCCKCTHQDDQY